MIKDSGERREFSTGAVRDIQEGKGRTDLLPLLEVHNLLQHCYEESDMVLADIYHFMQSGQCAYIEYAILQFCGHRGWDLPTAILEVSKHYEEGCKKYGDRNWEKGIPLHCYIDSGVRHYLKWLRGDDDEPHDRAFIWNMLGLLWTYNHKPEMNDL